MRSIDRGTTVKIELPDDAAIFDLSELPAGQKSALPRGRRPLPSGPVPMPSATDGHLAEALMESLAAQDLMMVDAMELGAAPGSPQVRQPGTISEPIRLSVDLASTEDALLLLEQGGVYSWHFADASATTIQPPERRGTFLAPARRRIAFVIAQPEAISPAEKRKRGPIFDYMVGKIRAYVFKYVAAQLAEKSIAVLERKVEKGLVKINSPDCGQWRRIRNLADVPLPDDKPIRILLLVHGTFSSTVGSFGALSGSQWGREFIEKACGHYDAVLGYDHPTLSLNPLENATDLLARLEHGSRTQPLVIDSVAFSRGALVLRSLVEYLLPMSFTGIIVRRGIFVGATNGGTQLAEPGNWRRMIDLYTNLAVAACKAMQYFAPTSLAGTVLKESVTTIGQFAKALTTTAIEEGRIPGLAAMDPNGPFVRDINLTQPGQPGIADTYYCIVTSDFDVSLAAGGGNPPELPKRFFHWLIDAAADQLARTANDLVVDVDSMAAIDPEAGTFVKERYDFGKNPNVYHTIYFTRPEVVRAMTRWLQLDPAVSNRMHQWFQPAAIKAPHRADPDLVVVNANDGFNRVVKNLMTNRYAYTVVRRMEDYGDHYYAFQSRELTGLSARLIDRPDFATLSLRDALRFEPMLDLHEGTISMRTAFNAPLPTPPMGAPPSAGRTILFDADIPVGVIDPMARVPSNEELAALGGVEKRVIGRYVLGVDLMGGPLGTGGGAGPGGTLGADSWWDADKSGGMSPADAPAAEPLPDGSEVGGMMSAPMSIPSKEGAGPPPPPAAPEPARQPAPGVCHFGATMPEQIAVGVAQTVQVTLSRDALDLPTGVTSGTGSGRVDYSRRFIVQLIPKANLKVIGDDRAEIATFGDRQRIDLFFDVAGTDIGAGELWVYFRQGPEPFGTLSLKPEIVAVGSVDTGAVVRARGEGAPETPEKDVYPLLQIFEVNNGTTLRYHFVLNLEDGTPFSNYSPPIQTDRETYVAGLYQRIENRWVSNKDDAAAFEEELRAYGGQLFEELIPPDIQAALWQHRNTLTAVHVISEEPFIPWELVHLKAPANPGAGRSPLPAETCFLAQLGLVRWLHNRGRAPRRLKSRPQRAYYAIPDYPHPDWRLPAAQAEIAYLVRELKAAPVRPQPKEVRELLTTPDTFDLFHFSGHGQATAGKHDVAKIMLEGRIEDNRYIPAYLDSTTVQQFASMAGEGGTKPIVVLNACQVARGSWQLTSIGGFAEAFLSARAGCFVGTLWSVGDSPARSFTESFYGALLAGQTLVEATASGREAARNAGEATWLAYVVYGHPRATLSR